MLINKLSCPHCHGRGITEEWVVTKTNISATTSTAVKTEVECSSCKGSGYGSYPVFTVWEAIEIAKHFGFKIEGLEDENND